MYLVATEQCYSPTLKQVTSWRCKQGVSKKEGGVSRGVAGLVRLRRDQDPLARRRIAVRNCFLLKFWVLILSAHDFAQLSHCADSIDRQGWVESKQFRSLTSLTIYYTSLLIIVLKQYL